jgi:hypothetical protein
MTRALRIIVIATMILSVLPGSPTPLFMAGIGGPMKDVIVDGQKTIAPMRIGS